MGPLPPGCSGKVQLKSGQQVNGNDIKEFTKTYKALADFGIENIYVHDQSLLARGIDPDKLMIDTKLLDSKSIAGLIRQHDRVFNF